MSEKQDDEVPQPRQPQNLQGLFRFALEATQSEDAPNPSSFAVMDEERRKFLEEALKSMTVDCVEYLEKSKKVLLDKETTEDEQVEALEVLLEFVDNIDTANDFFKIGGFEIFTPCLNSQYASVRLNTCSLISELAQNNPFCQEKLHKLDVIPKLIELLQETPDIAKTAMHAISCIIRNYEPAQASFIEIGGLECTLGCLASENEKLVIRTAFLMAALCTEYSMIREEYVKLNAVEKLISIIKPVDNFDSKVETALRVLELLVKDNSLAIQKCHKQSDKLKPVLDKIILNKEKPECNEMIEYCTSIKTICSLGNEKDDTDR